MLKRRERMEGLGLMRTRILIRGIFFSFFLSHSGQNASDLSTILDYMYIVI